MKRATIKNLFTAMLFFAVIAFSQPDTLEYSADRVEYSVKDSIITLSTNAQIDYKGIKLTADSIFYFTNTKTMIATGNPVLIDGGDTLRGEYIAYNIEKKSGKVKYGLMYSDLNSTYYSQRIARTDSSIYAHHGLYTTCLFPDHPHSHFYFEKIRIIPNEKTIVKPFVLVVGDAPVAALPYFIIPLEKDRTSGWLPIRWGVTLNGRGDIDNIGYYWAVNDYLDLMAAAKIDNFKNFLVKAQTRYALKDVLSGSIYTDYSISDQFSGLSNRWSLNFSHDQNLLPDKSFTLRGNGRLVSDKKYFMEFSDDTISLANQDLSSNLSLTKRFDNIGGYASLTWNRSQNLHRETVSQDMPALNFTLNNRPLVASKDPEKQNVFNKITWGYSFKGNRKISECTKTDSSYYRANSGLSQSLSASVPFSIFDHIRITPNFSVKQALFDSYYDTASVVYSIIEKLYDTIPIEDAWLPEFTGKEKDTVFAPSRISQNKDYVLVVRDSIQRFERRRDTTYHYDKNYDISKAHSVWWETGVKFSTDLYGIFPIKIGKMQGVRHTLSPNIGYDLVPERNSDVGFISVGIDNPPGGDKRKQIMSFGASNLFETKISSAGLDKNDSAKVGSKKINLLTLNVSGSYNFEADSQKMGDVMLSAGIPAPKVNLSYSGRFHPYDTRNEADIPKPLSHTINVTPILPSLEGSFWSGDLILRDGLQYYGYLDNVWKESKSDWRINITPRYTYTLNRKNVDDDFRANKSYNLSAGISINLTERWSISWNGTWSFTENTFINQSIAVSADLECWDLKLDWYPSGYNSGRIYFVAALKKHRDLKWEQQEK